MHHPFKGDAVLDVYKYILINEVFTVYDINFN